MQLVIFCLVLASFAGASLTPASVGIGSASPWSHELIGTMISNSTDTEVQLGGFEVPVLDNTGMKIKLTMVGAGCEADFCLSAWGQIPNSTHSQWGDLCFSLSNSANSQTTTVYPRPVIYHGAGYLVKGSICTLKVALSGKQCTVASYGNNCQSSVTTKEPTPDDPIMIGPSGHVTIVLHPDHAHGIPSMETKISLEGGKINGVKATIYRRQETFPIIGNLAAIDGTYYSNGSTATVVVETPRAAPHKHFNQFMTIVNNAENDTLNITGIDTVTHLCPNDVAGSQCQYRLTALDVLQTYSSASFPANKEVFYYGRIVFTLLLNEFSVGALGFGSQNPSPSIYLRYGNIPTLDNYDIKIQTNSSNTIGRQEAAFYETGLTDVSRAHWYVLFYSPNQGDAALKGLYHNQNRLPPSSSSLSSYPASPSLPRSPEQIQIEGYQFGIWVSTPCAGNCDGVGVCTSHVCQCPVGVPNQNSFTCERKGGSKGGDDHDNSNFMSEYSWVVGAGAGAFLFVAVLCIYKCKYPNEMRYGASRYDYLTDDARRREPIRKKGVGRLRSKSPELTARDYDSMTIGTL